MAPESITYFISYSRKDQVFAKKLARDLRAKGVSLWMDQLDIRAGDDWDDSIESALESCGGMILVLSPDSRASRNVKAEWSYMLEHGREIYPVIHQACKVPFRLRIFQQVDFLGEYEPAFQILVRALSYLQEDSGKSDTGTTEAHSRISEFPNSRINEVHSDLVFVKGGTFWMSEGDEKGFKATVRDYYIAKYPVTFEEYDMYCRAERLELLDDQGWGRGKRPVINVSWYDAVKYCNWRSGQEGLQKVYTIRGDNVTANWETNGYRLPTEAEWEFAAREGKESVKPPFTYSGSDTSDEVAWYWKNSGNKTQPVGQKKPNALGIYDMSGNVWDWCWDWYGKYPSNSVKDPRGPDSGENRVLRGGPRGGDAQSSRVSVRGLFVPDFRISFGGFRLARY